MSSSLPEYVCGELKLCKLNINIIQINMDAQQTKEIEARHNDILQLEKSIKELHDLFMDMCTLVQEQARLLKPFILIRPLPHIKI